MPQESKENMSQVLEGLTEKFEDPRLLVQEILGKTQEYPGFQLVLVGKVVQNILESRSSNSNIPEQEWIQNLIQEGTISNWIEKAVNEIEQNTLKDLDETKENVDNPTNNEISILPKILALIIFFMAFVGFPVIFLINQNNTADNLELNPSESPNQDRKEQPNLNSENCANPIPSNPNEQDELIRKLESDRKKSGENFSPICSEQLYSLWIEATPRLATGNPTQTVRRLCQIPKDSDSFEDAKFWINRWSNSEDDNLRNLVQTYIQQLSNECLAAEDFESEDS